MQAREVGVPRLPLEPEERNLIIVRGVTTAGVTPPRVPAVFLDPDGTSRIFTSLADLVRPKFTEVRPGIRSPHALIFNLGLRVVGYPHGPRTTLSESVNVEVLCSLRWCIQCT